MVLQLDEDVSRVEHVLQLAEHCLAAIGAVLQDALGRDSAEAAGEGDQAFAALGDLRSRDRRAVRARRAQVPFRDEPNQVFVTLLARCQEH